MTDAIQTLVDRIKVSLKRSSSSSSDHSPLPLLPHSAHRASCPALPLFADDASKPLLQRSDSAIDSLCAGACSHSHHHHAAIARRNSTTSIDSIISPTNSCFSTGSATATSTSSSSSSSSSASSAATRVNNSLKSASKSATAAILARMSLSSSSSSSSSTTTPQTTLASKVAPAIAPKHGTVHLHTPTATAAVDVHHHQTPLNILAETALPSQSPSPDSVSTTSSAATTLSSPLLATNHASLLPSFGKPAGMVKSASSFSVSSSLRGAKSVVVRDIVYDSQMNDYADDIFDHLRDLEEQVAPRPDYMDAVQTTVEPWMRNELIDYLVGVAEDLTLCKESVYHATNYLDRFLASRVVSRDSLECAFLAALLAATKYEEISPPTLREIASLMDDYFTCEEIVALERQLLGSLKYRLNVVTSHSFLDRYLQAADAATEGQAGLLAEYLCDLALADYDMLQFLPSEVAAAAVVIATHTLGRECPWDASMEYYTGYRFADLLPCIHALHGIFTRAPFDSSIPHIRRKFSSPRKGAVAKLSPCPDPPVYTPPALSAMSSAAPSACASPLPPCKGLSLQVSSPLIRKLAVAKSF
ncbi:hypothetical protein RI367_005584 [Sorochytrium milnesiophthora]